MMSITRPFFINNAFKLQTDSIFEKIFINILLPLLLRLREYQTSVS